MMGTHATNLISGKAATHNAAGAIRGAIQNASAETGVDFNYLMQQAHVESGMNPSAKAKTSSATGLYQFIEQTWLKTMKTHGAEHGYGRYANAIQQKSNGDLTVPNRALRNEILNLRKDPKAASLMAAELAGENHAYLQSTVGGELSKTDLYMAHFLGAGGAANFLKSMKKNPWAPAASIFPEAARSNRGVFYAQGRPLSLQQVYNRFEAKFQTGGNDAAVIQTAQAQQPAKSSYFGDIALPEATDWSNPVARRLQRFDTQNRTAGLATFYTAPTNTIPQAVQISETTTTERIPGGFLSSPVEVMLMANRMQHNDNDRYNT